MAILALLWGLLTSRAGIITLACLGSLAVGIWGTSKVTGWWHEHELNQANKERDQALADLNQAQQKVRDLEATIKFQRGQLALRQRVQKEGGDVKKAVVDNDRDFLRRNFQRLYDYKNPAAAPAHAGGDRPGPGAPAQTPATQRSGLGKTPDLLRWRPPAIPNRGGSAPR